MMREINDEFVQNQCKKFLISLSANDDDDFQLSLYTKESIVENFEEVFGIKSLILAERLYYHLAKRKSEVIIGVLDMLNFFMPFFNDSQLDVKQKRAFYLYDADGDGYLSS
jgi:hypothetical protein